MAMQITPGVLENRFVRLEPLADGHRQDLRASCDADPDTWRDLYLFSWAGSQFEPSWARYEREKAAGRSIPYAVVADGRCGGITTFTIAEPGNAVVEIGGTYYRPELRGGATNPAAKRLLLGHTFDCGARRVVFRVDAINARSRAAVTKLGAVQEGILRQDRITWTGRMRDTVVFSILADEWPAVSARLDARLATFEKEPAHAA